MIKLVESKELSVYKLLLWKFQEYVEKFPASGTIKKLDLAIAAGKKLIPTDKKAKEILELVLENGTSGEAIQYLLNRRFSDLPTINRPVYKNGDNKCIAFWCKKDGLVSDMIKDLLNLDGEASGHWSDLKGKKVSLLEK